MKKNTEILYPKECEQRFLAVRGFYIIKKQSVVTKSYDKVFASNSIMYIS